MEEDEDPISDALRDKINGYGVLSLVKRLFRKDDIVSDQFADCSTAHLPGEELVQCLVDVLIRWRIGSQPNLIPVENEMRTLIALGVGHLDTIGPKFDPDTNYPVYICEPLIVLSLSLLFEECSQTTRRASPIRSAPVATHRLWVIRSRT